MRIVPAGNEPCPECGGTLDTWADGHDPGCRHPRRLQAGPPPMMLVWADVYLPGRASRWLIGSAGDVRAALEDAAAGNPYGMAARISAVASIN